MINKINQDSTNFQAKLYSTKGKLIRSTDFFKPFGDNMSAKGSPKTDIFVSKIINKKLGEGIYNAYKVSADLKIENPLFGKQSFNQIIDNCHASACEDEIDELYFLDKMVGLPTDDCKRLENKALYMQIIEKFKTNLDNLTPSKILEKMLKETSQEQHGFTEERIKDFQKIANRMDESLENNNKFLDYEWLV